MSSQTQPPDLTLSDPWKVKDNIIRPYLLLNTNTKNVGNVIWMTLKGQIEVHVDFQIIGDL